MKVRLTKDDLKVANATDKEGNRQSNLACLHIQDGKLMAADGFVLAYRPCSTEGHAVIRGSMAKSIKQDVIFTEMKGKQYSHFPKKHPTTRGRKAVPSLTVIIKASKEKPLLYLGALQRVPREKKAVICLDPKLLKQALDTMPESKFLYLGLGGKGDPIELFCEGSDGVITRSIIMPMCVPWDNVTWEGQGSNDQTKRE